MDYRVFVIQLIAIIILIHVLLLDHYNVKMGAVLKISLIVQLLLPALRDFMFAQMVVAKTVLRTVLPFMIVMPQILIDAKMVHAELELLIVLLE
jgi:uncharacterized membrane protein YesL